MEFLYPTSRQFPFDEAAESIVRQLEKRNWQVPGITVKFDEYGSGEEWYRLVRSIRGRDFKLYFSRKQRTMPGGFYNDIAGVNEIVIPHQEIHVYHDESGPTYYRYVGGDWEKDCEQFINEIKVNSKLHGERRTYLHYKGECHCVCGKNDWFSTLPHTHSGCRPPLLVHNNSLGKEYGPEDNEPTILKSDEVMEEFRQYLEDVVLQMIMSQPESEIDLDYFPEPVTLAVPEGLRAIFTFGKYRDIQRIKTGKTDKEQLDRSERYGLDSGGYRLVSLGMPNDGTVPKIAYDGFKWCAFGEVDIHTDIDSLEIPGHYRWSDREQYVIRVVPNRANDIYVADHALYEKRREELIDANPEVERFTNQEVADFTRARARTIVPLSEYDGSFVQPIVLINRELSFDEVEVVSGPHKDWEYC